jgi:hypothetical protein
MIDVPKVLVVDDGERTADRAPSARLAALGLSSVTTSFEAAEDLLEVLPTPAAILLQLPGHADGERRRAILDLAERLKAKEAVDGVPVLVVEPTVQSQARAYSVLQHQFGARVFAGPGRFELPR